ncbi:MAG: hypothetical protein AB7S92_19465 [Parvibaculaceae bacterium]
MERLAARLNLIVDAETEAAARSIGRDFIAQIGLESVFLRWTPYRKLGAHSRLSFALYLPAGVADEAAAAAIEAIAARAVARHSLAKGYLNRFLNEDGSLFYNRIFDARSHEFLVADVLWMDVEVETSPDAQGSFKAALKQASPEA